MRFLFICSRSTTDSSLSVGSTPPKLCPLSIWFFLRCSQSNPTCAPYSFSLWFRICRKLFNSALKASIKNRSYSKKHCKLVSLSMLFLSILMNTFPDFLERNVESAIRFCTDSCGDQRIKFSLVEKRKREGCQLSSCSQCFGADCVVCAASNKRQSRGNSFTPYMMQWENRCARGVRLKISEVWVKLSTERLSLNTTDTGPKTVLSRFRLHHFACRKSNAENIYAVKFYASLDRMINQSLFFLAKVKVAYASPSANSLHFETW